MKWNKRREKLAKLINYINSNTYMTLYDSDIGHTRAKGNYKKLYETLMKHYPELGYHIELVYFFSQTPTPWITLNTGDDKALFPENEEIFELCEKIFIERLEINSMNKAKKEWQKEQIKKFMKKRVNDIDLTKSYQKETLHEYKQYLRKKKLKRVLL